MTIQEIIQERRSIRKYSDKPVSDTMIHQVLESGRWAPSSDNSQPWEFIIIKDQVARKRLSQISFWGRFLAQAPVAIAIVTDPRKSNTHIIDGTCATQNMMLAAWELGLGTCWIADINTEEAKRVLGVPRDHFIITITPLGFPDENPPEPKRKKLQKLIHQERY